MIKVKTTIYIEREFNSLHGGIKNIVFVPSAVHAFIPSYLHFLQSHLLCWLKTKTTSLASCLQ